VGVCCYSFVVSGIRVAKRNCGLMEAARPTINHSTVLLITIRCLQRPRTIETNPTSRRAGGWHGFALAADLGVKHAHFALAGGRFRVGYARRGGRAESHKRVLNAADTHSLTRVIAHIRREKVEGRRSLRNETAGHSLRLHRMMQVQVDFHRMFVVDNRKATVE
jgi:hypothetical protein